MLPRRGAPRAARGRADNPALVSACRSCSGSGPGYLRASVADAADERGDTCCPSRRPERGRLAADRPLSALIDLCQQFAHCAPEVGLIWSPELPEVVVLDGIPPSDDLPVQG